MELFSGQRGTISRSVCRAIYRSDMDLFSGQCVKLFTGQMWTCFRVNVWSYLQVRCGPVFGSMCGAINRSGVELFSGQCMELFSSVPYCARERVCVRARAFNGLS